MERKPRRTIWSKKAKLLSTLLAVTLLCTTIIPGSVFAQDDVLETDPLVVETVESEEPAAEEQPAEEVTPVVEEEAPAATEETTEEQPVATEETEEEATESPVAAYVADLEGLLEEAKSLDAEAEDLESQCADIYDAAMAVYDEACTKWENNELTDDEMAQVEEATMEVWTYLETEYGYDPYDTETYAGPSWGGDDEDKPDQGQTGGYSLSMSHYQPTSYVYWQVMTGDSTNGYSVGTQSTITRVDLNTSLITSDNADAALVTAAGTAAPPTASGAKQLSYYYPGVANGDESSDVTLKITPATGYYVTRVIVACCGMDGESSQYSCNTWKSEAAYEKTFELSNDGYITTDLPSEAFGHSSDSSKYVILICVAPIPSPLYVEYNYGEITQYMANAGITDTSIFTGNADGWTDESSNNVYAPEGTTADNGIKTNDTQFKYAYDGTSPNVTAWKHYANTITNDAKVAAANSGYYFTGWAAEYYEKVTVTDTSGSYNNYKYDFSELNSTASYTEGANVNLITNVKLTAQWKPIELNVTKTVKGLSGTGFVDVEHEYTLQVQKLDGDTWKDYGEALSYAITGNDSSTQTISPVTPGTYRVIETGGNIDLSDGSTIMYISVSDGGQVSYNVSDIIAGKNVTQSLEVVNSYSPEPAKYDLTVQKTVTGNMGDVNKEFAFTVKYGDETKTFNLKDDGTYTIEGIPVGTTVTVTEVPDGYEYSFVSITDGVTKTDITNGVSFTMPSKNVTVVINNHKDVLIDTNVFLDNTPYILALGVVLASGTAMIFRRRKLNADK